MELGTYRIYPWPQLQGPRTGYYCLPCCKYEGVEIRVENAVEERLVPQTDKQNEVCVQADLTEEINLVFTEIYERG
jgi:hypothetical protein